MREARAERNCFFSITGATTGDYRLTVYKQQWWKFTNPPKGYLDLHLGDGQNLSGYAFGAVNDYVPGPYISGTVFNDLNDSLRRDSMEGGLGDVTVYDDGNFNGILDADEISTQTDVTGSYLLSGPLSDPYHLRTILPVGWKQTVSSINGYLPNDGGEGEDIAVTESPSVNTSIRGTVFNDANGNGRRDSGERGISLARVYNDANNNNVLDADETVTVTDADGLYQFNNLTAGSYKIRQILPAGFSQTTPANNYGWTISLSKVQNVTGKDFGRKQSAVTSNGSISGTVFNDLDGDPVKDSNEVGVGNVTIYNDANNNSRLDAGELTTTTDSNGAYTLANLAAGPYKIREILQSGWSQTTPTNNYGWTISLATNQQLTGKNFGTKQSGVTPPTGTGSISGIAFNDNNKNGAFDTGDQKTGGKAVFLDANNNGKLDSGEKSLVSDANGNWGFAGLSAGTYHVRRVFPSGYTYSTTLIDVTLNAGDNDTGFIIGSKKLS